MQAIPILLNADIIMVFARKKQLAASKILVYTQALQEYSRTRREETLNYKFTADDYR